MELQTLLRLRSRAPGAAAIALLAAMLASPAPAQSYPDDDVSVNGGDRVLLYPDGTHVRVVSPLRQPGESDVNQPIHLHMPVHHHAAHVATPEAEEANSAAQNPGPKTPAKTPKASVSTNTEPALATSSNDPLSYGWAEPTITPTASQPQPAKTVARSQHSQPVAKISSKPPTRAERRKAVEAALAQPLSASTSPAPARSNIGVPAPFSFESTDITLPAVPAASIQATAPAKQSKPSKQKPTAAPPVDFASTEPASGPIEHNAKQKNGGAGGAAKQGEILFPGGAADPQAASFDEVKSLAAGLNTALDSGPARVEIDAYGGKPGDKSSDARRLSLRRALAIRQLLIDNGVPADRIDVRALGGVEDHGNSDRVDVLLREG